MKAISLALIIMVSFYMVIAAPVAAAQEEGSEESVAFDDDPSTDVAYGIVRVTVIEWEPDLEGVGAGLFTESEFDFSGFINELCESIASLFGF
jgi:hypothetical protein